LHSPRLNRYQYQVARQSVLIFSSRKTNSLMEGGWIWTQGATAQHSNPRASEWGRTDGRFGSNRERQSNSYSNGENPSEESSEVALITHRRQRGKRPKPARADPRPLSAPLGRERSGRGGGRRIQQLRGGWNGGPPSRPPSLWARYRTRSGRRGAM